MTNPTPHDYDHTASLDVIRTYWDERAVNLSSDCDKVNASKRAQRMRFEAFVLFHDLNHKSILDVGCGVGDLWEHLVRREIVCDYLGVDISQEMVNRSQERFPSAHFECHNILEWEPPHSFDYVAAIAIHNVKIRGGRELLEAMTRRQFQLCRVATYLSLLTNRYQGFADHIQAWPPEEVLAMALSITPYVVIRHDYLPNDFGVTLYRKPLIDTYPDLHLD